MIKRILSKCINKNISYVINYHIEGHTASVVIYDRTFNTDLMLTEKTIRLWIHDIILEECGLDYKI